MKRNLLLLFALMAIGLSHALAYDFSAVSPSDHTLYYNIVNGNAQVTFQNNTNPRYTSLSGAIVIPEQVTYNEITYTVTSISNYAFTGCTGITSVTLPNTLTSIGENAFQNCTGMTTLTIGTGLTSVRNRAFQSCSSLVTINYNATNSGNFPSSSDYYVFKGCLAVRTINIGSNVQSIPSYAFNGCENVFSIIVPDNVTSIGSQAFSGFQNVIYSGSATGTWGAKYCNGYVDGSLVFSDQTRTSVVACDKIITSVIVPDGTTSIGDKAFSGCSALASITLPSSLTTIGTSAFENCSSLTAMTVPDGVTTIGEGAFKSCSNIRNITLGNSVSTVGASAFQSCNNMTDISIPATLTSFGLHAFHTCPALQNVDYHGTIAQWCAITFVGNMSTPNHYASHFKINGVEVTDLVIPDDVTIVKKYAFHKCNNITSLTIGTGLQTAEVDAFSNSGIRSITYRATNATTFGVDNSGHSVFKDCVALTNITIEDGVQRIPANCFNGCSRVQTISLPASVSQLGANCFSNCSSLTQISIPDAVTSIPIGCFSYCTSLARIDLPASLASVGGSAFGGCNNLSQVRFAGSVAQWCGIDFQLSGSNPLELGHNLYIGNVLVSDLVVPSEVTIIKKYAFLGATCLNTVTFNNNNGFTVQERAFEGCTSINRVNFNGTIAQWCTNSFIRYGDNHPSANPLYYAHHLYIDDQEVVSIVIPEGVTEIKTYCFEGCTNILSAIVGRDVRTIMAGAFDGCSNLTIFDLTNINNFTKTSYGTVKRVVKCSNYGTGENAIHQIPNSFSLVESEDDDESHIPASLIPDNFIYQDNGNWKAKNIVLTDCENTFEAPVEFTAENVTYKRELTDGNRSTLCLPFTTTIPSGLEVFEFVGFDGSTISFAQHNGNIEAYTPYLVGKNISKSTTEFTFSKQNAVFPATPATIATSPISGMTFHGTMQRTGDLPTNCYGYKDGYFVQSGGSAHVNPFRCYFTWNGDPLGTPQSLSVDTDGDYLGIEDVEGDMEQSSIRYSNDVYDLMGRLVRKNAESLRGLPKGIYIWRGKKHMAF